MDSPLRNGSPNRGFRSYSPPRAASTLLGDTSPSTSPNRIRMLADQGLINQNTPAYRSAMEKITTACWKFDRSKDGSLLKSLDNRELLPEQFRQMLRSGMDCKLSHEEFAAVQPLFDNKGLIDGSEFILLFYRLRYEHRDKELKDRVAYERQNREMLKEHQEKRRAEMGARKVIELVTTFTPGDLQSALDKMKEGALKYDKNMPGSVPIDAFNVYSMNSGEFLEQLKKVFQVILTIPELSAFLHDFNKDNEDKTTIICAPFLVTFLRLGFTERTRRIRAVWAEKKRIQREQERKRHREDLEKEKKHAAQINRNFTEEEKETAIIKLRAAAKLYDKTTPGAMSMKAFEVKEMPPHVFKEQLKRVFNLNLNPVEMGAIMSVFDVNGDGVITCEEFTKVFINMGFEEREKELKAAIEKQKRYEQRQQEQHNVKARELASKNAMKVSYEYSEEESHSAMEKLLDAAWRYDKNMPGAPSLDAFESHSMEPHVFKEQLRRAFMMKITPPELGAIMHYFDPERTGYIVCSDFLKKFFKMGFDERQRRKAQWRELQKELIARRLEEDKRKLETLEKKTSLVSASANHDFTEADFHSAMAKLTHAAFKYDRALPGAASLNAFEAISMPPHIFKEQLKMIFNVKVTLPELWALVSFYDRNHTGEIHCKEFISQFLSTGFAERERVTRKWRKEKLQRKLMEEKLHEQKEEEKRLKAWSEVDFDFLESDFDAALWKFLMVGFNFDRRQVGPNGLKFDVETWNPAEFREVLKRTFNVKITARELGAFVNYFDTMQNKTVHVSTFLNMFTHVRVDCEEFKGKKGEQQRLQEYFHSLKQEYQQRMAKNTSVDARPWRQNSTLTVQKGLKAVFKKKDHVKPVTPLEKYKLRILIGRRTGKMDLACKSIWATTSPSAQGSVAGAKDKKTAAGEAADDETLETKDDEEEEEEEEEDEDEREEARDGVDGDEGEKKDRSGDDEPTAAAAAATAHDETAAGGAHDPLGLDLLGPVDHQSSVSDVAESEVMFADMALHTTRSTEDETTMPVDDPVNPVPLVPEIEFRLSTIPPEVLRLTELRELWLCNHLIPSIPPKIGGLQQLQVLSLKHNGLDVLPVEICKLENLERFYASGNHLSSLPNLFGRLTRLKELDLSRNAFTDFPEVLTSLRSLLRLDISHNKIATLPMTMRQMRSLVLLNLEDNPLIPSKPKRVRLAADGDDAASAATAAANDDDDGATPPPPPTSSSTPAVTVTSPPPVLSHLYWVEIIGLHREALPIGDRAAKAFTLTPAEDFELAGMLKSRAVATAANKLRHRKKKNHYIL